jgi:hypothetical protein
VQKGLIFSAAWLYNHPYLNDGLAICVSAASIITVYNPFIGEENAEDENP